MNYLEDIYILSHIKRYSTVHTIREESVAEHGYFVAAIVMKLHEYYNFDLGVAVQVAIAHDIPEMELNDVPRLIKNKYPAIAKAFKECEQEVKSQLPPSVQVALDIYAETMPMESKIVHYADAIQCEQFSLTEVKLGNKGYMDEVLIKSRERIAHFNKILEPYRRKRNV